ncbi:alpha/beta hydrolase [Psychrobium sp. nBUS_13]|uniref:alpha/beta hydrolase n=1 Tax=Psychrobium sp. nBUS_13 TaxID=3395319 RepID=UPI003EB72883
MRRKIYLFAPLLVIIGLISGCNGSSKTTSDSVNIPLPENIESVNIQDRKYYIAKPEKNFSPQKSYKLLLAFHGSGQSAQDMLGLAKLEANSNNYLVVYPQSKVEEWNEGCDCNKPHRLGINDLGFVENVVKDIKENYNIIDDELYAVGFSQGALFTQNLMCNSQLKFKAIASIAAPMSQQLSESCQIDNDTNYLLVQGEADTVLPYQGKPSGNFALIGSEQAIDLIAKQNNIENAPEVTQKELISKHTYQNEFHINQLVAIAGAGHRWSFDGFDTSKEVLNFFDSVSTKKLEPNSSLYRVTDNNGVKDIHVRSMGLEHSGPAVILLSGFNKNYHADSAWFSLLQPLIAKNHRVHVIERLGNGFSTFSDTPSYTAFAPLLDKTLTMLDEQAIVMVSFASSNILAQAWKDLPDSKTSSTLKGMLWIDPDIFLPHSIAHYQDWPVSLYRQIEDRLIPHLEAGGWTERSRGKLVLERAEHEQLISDEYINDMDWTYYDLISQQRLNIDKQITRAKEVINYHDDLVIMKTAEISSDTPISIIDTDFETADIENAETSEEAAKLTKWQQEGTQWSKLISERSNGQYIFLDNSAHMVVFEHPKPIIDAIKALMNE